jgi:hypothetical protein
VANSFITLNPTRVAVTGLTTQTQVAVFTSASEVISVTQVVTVPVTSFRLVSPTPASSPNGSLQPQPASSEPNLSWVAAPVVGGIAAILVVIVMFIMARKKREGYSWKPSFSFRAPFRPSRGVQRLEDGPDDNDTPVYEVKGGKMSLRGGSAGVAAASKTLNIFRK